MTAYIYNEAPRFYLELDTDASSNTRIAHLSFRILPEKAFLHTVMLTVEEQELSTLESYAGARELELEHHRPMLLHALQNTHDGEMIYQLVHNLNSRWMMVYDADADAPIDILRHLAGRIMTDDTVMGFQGPVAPLLNYDEVHPICRMAGLWMGFWHGADYPRLLHKAHWAHPLAGTNWCFHLDGMEHDGKLIRSSPYEEKRRHFLLTFDPKQLTEDLEAGIRHFSDWSVNAEWHPIAEVEQVPPTAKAMFSQHTRWALGTLQTMSYIMSSNLLWTQKAWYFLGPVRIGLASSGPIITVTLIIAFLLDAFVTDPVLAWWAMLLGFGNLVYFWAFSSTFERYYDTIQHAAAVDYIYAHGTELINELDSYRKLDKPLELKSAGETLRLLKKGLQQGGFIQKYLGFRCRDDDDSYGNEKLRHYVSGLIAETPGLVRTQVIHDFIQRFQYALQNAEEHVAALSSTQAPEDMSEQMQILNELVRNATYRAGANRRPRWSRYHTQILLWSIPYMYSSVYPFYKAFVLWTRGEKVDWYKTVRTEKKAPKRAA
jgi:hypothetical protein